LLCGSDLDLHWTLAFWLRINKSSCKCYHFKKNIIGLCLECLGDAIFECLSVSRSCEFEFNYVFRIIMALSSYPFQSKSTSTFIFWFYFKKTVQRDSFFHQITPSGSLYTTRPNFIFFFVFMELSKFERESAVSRWQLWCWNSSLSDSAGPAVSLTALMQNQQSVLQLWCWISGLSDSAGAKLAVSLTMLMLNQRSLWQLWCWISNLATALMLNQLCLSLTALMLKQHSLWQR
jgi:hypothetical protein